MPTFLLHLESAPYNEEDNWDDDQKVQDGIDNLIHHELNDSLYRNIFTLEVSYIVSL